MPKQKTRTLPPLAFLTPARICSSSVVPMVGRPSVRKMTTKGRSLVGDEVTSLSPAGLVRASSRRLLPSRYESAFLSASSIAVPPMGLRSLMKLFALSRFALSAETSLSNNGSTSVENRAISKRSPSFRFSTQNSNAFLACSSFLPAIEPDVSSTNTTSFFTKLFSFTSTPGDASTRKKPSSPATRCVSRLMPTSSFSGEK